MIEKPQDPIMTGRYSDASDKTWLSAIRHECSRRSCGRILPAHTFYATGMRSQSDPVLYVHRFDLLQNTVASQF